MGKSIVTQKALDRHGRLDRIWKQIRTQAVRRLAVLLAAVLSAGLTAGCTPLDVNPSLSWLLPGNDEPQAPRAVVVVWSDAVLQRSNGPPIRGFGGRLMFYANKEGAPVRVDGSLVVYAFDEDDPDAHDPRPDRKYVFTREQLAKHYSKSKLGHSYSVWVPWDKAGGPKKEISLVTRFMPADGAAVFSDQTKLTLPGTSTPAPSSQAMVSRGRPSVYPKGAMVSPTGYCAPAESQQPDDAEHTSPKRRMTTTTIRIPPQFGRARPVARGTAASPRRRTRRAPRDRSGRR